ncbi:MAG: hypothetical protein V4687_02350 [Bacteroidota bacterium]
MENTQEKDLNPYEFTIEIAGEPNAVRVELPKPGDYIIYINGERTGHIYRETATGKVWDTKDEIDPKLVKALGAQIELIEEANIH